MKNIMMLALFLLSFNVFSKEDNVIVKEACTSMDKGRTAVVQCSNGNTTIINDDKTTVCASHDGMISCKTIDNKN